jgi:hypothetical protein
MSSAESNGERAVEADESTPLITNGKAEKKSKADFYKALLCGFLVALSFGVTQVPLIYAFRIMTCEGYYQDPRHPDPGGPNRCANREIEASSSRAIAVLGFSTTGFGVVNLFVTSWTIKRFSLKTALAIQIFWPTVRLLVQNIGVMTGGYPGILIIELSQIMTIVGGPSGYLLALNSFVTEVVDNKERTGALGRLQGCGMLGTSIGFLFGGLVADWFGIQFPFRLALGLFSMCTLYVLTVLPRISVEKGPPPKSSSGIKRFFGPLKMFVPHKWVLSDGRVRREYGALVLGIGVSFGILATGYIPILLQLFSADVLGFGSAENGLLISMHSFVRGLFLSLVFPRLISSGRAFLDKRKKHKTTQPLEAGGPNPIPDLPTEPNQFVETDGINAEEPIEPPKPKMKEGREQFEFDLLFTRYSLIADGLLTGICTFVTQGWQLYGLAFFLPLASGTGAAAKGSILQMCSASERPDALSAITLVEMIARLTTTSIFGVVYAAFATIGQPRLVFTVNAVSLYADDGLSRSD